ncbi:hypothetical protein Y032_0680g1467 [Ancylostoma ceylanicum]|uniref:Uncharacterized protein n=1 Tax=Ancylostoma ceylanicum TaxID=53326 RepID=A0A016WHG2_9BILA|nr:hypothetical protein Y032_0680g1467 [Ancylostoma ceylanicum]
MSSSSSYSGSSAVYSDSSRASTPEPTVPPPANVTAPAPPQEAPAGEPAPEAVAHVEEERNSDGYREHFVVMEGVAYENLEPHEDDMNNKPSHET